MHLAISTESISWKFEVRNGIRKKRPVAILKKKMKMPKREMNKRLFLKSGIKNCRSKFWMNFEKRANSKKGKRKKWMIKARANPG